MPSFSVIPRSFKGDIMAATQQANRLTKDVRCNAMPKGGFQDF